MSSTSLFFKIVFPILGPLQFHLNFRVILPVIGRRGGNWDLVGIVLNLLISLGSIVISAIFCPNQGTQDWNKFWQIIFYYKVALFCSIFKFACMELYKIFSGYFEISYFDDYFPQVICAFAAQKNASGLSFLTHEEPEFHFIGSYCSRFPAPLCFNLH